MIFDGQLQRFTGQDLGATSEIPENAGAASSSSPKHPIRLKRCLEVEQV